MTFSSHSSKLTNQTKSNKSKREWHFPGITLRDLKPEDILQNFLIETQNVLKLVFREPALAGGDVAEERNLFQGWTFCCWYSGLRFLGWQALWHGKYNQMWYSDIGHSKQATIWR